MTSDYTIERLIMGDSNTFKVIFDTLYNEMVSFAGYFVDDQQVAEDIVQEAFIKLWEKRKTLLLDTSIKAYLHTLIRNSALNHIEHLQVVDKYKKNFILSEIEENDNVEEFIKLVKNLLEKLPEKRRRVLVLSVLESKKYSEIAVELDISVNTVKDHIKKAYSFLREEAKQNISHLILFFACREFK